MLTQLVRTLESLNAPTHKVAAEVCAFFLVAIVVSVAGQVFWRFVLLSPLIWTEKASIFALSRLVLLGTSLGVRIGTHLVCDFLPAEMTRPLRIGLALFDYVMIGVVGEHALEGDQAAGKADHGVAPGFRTNIEHSILPPSSAQHLVPPERRASAAPGVSIKGPATTPEPSWRPRRMGDPEPGARGSRPSSVT